MQNDINVNGLPGQQSNLNPSTLPGEKSYQAGLDAYWGRNNKPENLANAFLPFQQAAEQKHPKGIAYLAILYIEGHGTKKNKSKGEKLFQNIRPKLEKLAEEGDAEAQHCLGDMYANGYGVDRSYSMALKYYKDAANQNYAFSKIGLGEIYEDPFGWIENETGWIENEAECYVEAMKWFKKAADENNNGNAKVAIAELYRDGCGGIDDQMKSDKKAIKKRSNGLKKPLMIMMMRPQNLL